MSALAEVPGEALIQSLRPPVPRSNDAFRALRELARAALEETAFPSVREEEWRFTDLAFLGRQSFFPAETSTTKPIAIAESLPGESGASRIVLFDGVLDAGVTTHPSGESPSVRALDGFGPAPPTRFGTLAAPAGRFFSALNAASFPSATCIHVNRDAPAPLHVVHALTQPGRVSFPRLYVEVDPGCRAMLVEEYVGVDASALCVPVTEVVLGRDAELRHIRVLRESRASFHIGRCAIALAASARYHAASISFGGRLSRFDLDLAHGGHGAHCTLDGLALINARQHADSHTTIDHLQPHGSSRQLHKCIVGGAGRAVFNGTIRVHEGAQRTEAVQSSRNLLLSERAHVDTKPQLEIFADNVKCAHGATVGRLDAEEVFYLKSRGLDEVHARALLVYAFAAEIIERLPIPSLVERLRGEVAKLIEASA